MVPFSREAEAPEDPGGNLRPTGQRHIQWRDIEALFLDMGAGISEREGGRVAVVLFGEVRVFHRPHPGPCTDKGAVASIRKWLEQHGVEP